MTATTQLARTGNRHAAKRAADVSTPPWRAWRTRSRTARAIRFMESYCVIPKGHGAGELMKVAPFQREQLEEVLEDGVRAAVIHEPRGNGKSTFTSGIALWGLHDDEHSPQVPVVATTLQQAIRTIFTTCRHMTRVSPELSNRTIEYTAIGSHRLETPWNDGILFPLPADPDGLQGLDPSLAVVDEVGFVSQELWDAMTLASGKRPRSLVLGIGTPNVTKSGAMYELHKLVFDEGAQLPGFKYLKVAAPDGCDIHDRTAWRQANPAIGAGFLAEDALAMAAASSPEASFRVFRLGQWAEAGECWLPVGAWGACEDRHELVDGAPTWVGLDVGLKRDTTAVVCVQNRPDGRRHATARIWNPTEGAFDLADVMAHLRALCDRYDVQSVLFDPRLFELPGQMLADEGLPMLEMPQTVERMSPACGYAYEQIVAGQVTHDPDDVFSAHVHAAQARPNDRGWTLSKNKSRRHIDAAIALVMALHRAATPQPAPVAPSAGWIDI